MILSGEDVLVLLTAQQLGGTVSGYHIAQELGWSGQYANVQAAQALVRLKNRGLMAHSQHQSTYGPVRFIITDAGRKALEDE